MNFKLIPACSRLPLETATYHTSEGCLKFDFTTQTFYKYGVGVTVSYWFEEVKTLEDCARPLIKFLSEKYHPHAKVIVTTTNAEVVEGAEATKQILDYIKD